MAKITKNYSPIRAQSGIPDNVPKNRQNVGKCHKTATKMEKYWPKITKN